MLHSLTIGFVGTPNERSVELSTEDLLAAVPDRIDPIPRSHAFRIRLVLCVAVLIVLVLIYAVLVAVTSYGLWSHFASTEILETMHHLLPSPGAYIFLCVAGPILCVFLVKPIFTLRLDRPASVRLDRSAEPRLFDFVDRLCKTQGAPTPREILVDTQVNASASLRHGLIGLFRDDLSLTIGLPLARSLTLREFTGVLTHEFGHFAQGSAMRLASVIRRSVMVMLRIVHERDGFDQALYEAGAFRIFLDPRLLILSLAFSLFIWSVLGLLWLARMLLKGLAWVGMVSTMSLLREMEYEADLHEARIVGCETFIETGNRLLVLHAARQAAEAVEQRAYGTRRLPEDLPDLVAILEARISALPETVREIREEALKVSTRRFDTHPALRDRVAAVQKVGDEAAFRLDAPASILFSDLPALSRVASLAVYRELLDMEFQAMRFLPVAEILYEIEGDAGISERVARLTRGCPTDAFSLAIGPVHGAATPGDAPSRDQAVQNLESARRRVLELAPRAVEAAGRLAEARSQHDRRLVVTSLMRYGFPIDPGPIGPDQSPSEATVEARRQAARAIDSAEVELVPFSLAVSDRLRNALRLQSTEDTAASGHASLSACESMAETLDQLGKARTHADPLRSRLAVLFGILQEAQREAGSPLAVRPVHDASGEADQAIKALRDAIDGIHYPFPLPMPEGLGDKTRPTIGHFLGHDMSGRDPIEVYSRGTKLLSTLCKLEDRILSALGDVAEQVEHSLGLPALPDLSPVDPCDKPT